MNRRRIILLAVTQALLVAAAFPGCASRSDEPDGGVAADGGARADGGPRADGGAPADGGTHVDGGTPADGGSSAVDSTITALQNAEVAPLTCVRVQVVAMSAVFDDRDDAFSPPDAGKINRKAFYVSEKNITTTAPRTGIEVVVDTDQPNPTVAPGDALTIEGVYDEHFDNSTIRYKATCGSITKTGTASMPAPATVTITQVGQTGSTTFQDGPNAEDYEGVLVKIAAGSVDQARNNFGEFEITDGTAKLLVSTHFGVTTSPNIGDTINATGITGFGHYSFTRRKLRPRADSEVGIAQGVANCGNAPKADHLLITEVKVSPSAGEFVEIHNPTASAIDLSNYYLYNATFTPNTDGGVSDGGTASPCRYYNVVTGTECGTAFGDFSLRFPAGASIGPGEYQVIAVTGAANYCTTYGCATAAAKPTYEVPAPAGCSALANDSAVPDMRGNWDQGVSVFCGADGGSATGFLTNNGEDLVLFTWSGSGSTVKDVDYFIWGTGTGYRTDKTGVSGYQADTAIASQRPASGAPSGSQSFQRVCMNEGSETLTGGNGITGHNETSENIDVTFVVRDPTPKAATSGAMP